MPDYAFFLYFCQENENRTKLEGPRLFISFSSLTPKEKKNYQKKKKKKVAKATLFYISFPSVLL